VLSRPEPRELPEVVDALRAWQYDAGPMQLHPGDLGWYQRFGAEAAATALRTWRRDGRILAVGLLDGPGLVRLGIAPEAGEDEDLAQRLVADLTDPTRGVLPAGEAFAEARSGELLRASLLDAGWTLDEPWAPLCRDLTEPVEECGLRIEITGPDRVPARVDVHRAAFERSTFTPERWQAMAAGPAYADARCLVGYDDRDDAVAAATVWSAGAGRPGLLEPVGVHRDHRGRGHGTAITLAAAATLRRLGSSTATVCTRSANVAAVATYESAGFERLPDVRDLRRR
jgi:ribosomal protein S18 acetylase RimI-like enzyme